MSMGGKSPSPECPVGGSGAAEKPLNPRNQMLVEERQSPGGRRAPALARPIPPGAMRNRLQCVCLGYFGGSKLILPPCAQGRSRQSR